MSSKPITVFTQNDATVCSRTRPHPGVYLRMNDDSPITGDFDVDAAALLKLGVLEPQVRARLATLVLNAEGHGRRPSAITSEMLTQAESSAPMPMQRRLDNLLQHIGDQAPSVGERVAFTHGDPGMLVASESVDASELRELLNHLVDEGFITRDETFGSATITLTTKGRMHLEQLSAPTTSGQAFVAMWFNPEVQALYEQSLKPAIEDAGFEAVRIDAVPTLDRIDEQIQAEIRQADCVVADFTHGADGVRGSVYYEVGFAHGLGKPVIFTCRQDQLSELQFDIRNFQHLAWTQPDDLRGRLAEQIKSLVAPNERN